MGKKKGIVLVAIAVTLLILNAYRWLDNGEPEMETVPSTGVESFAKLNLSRVLYYPDGTGNGRDIFNPAGMLEGEIGNPVSPQEVSITPHLEGERKSKKSPPPSGDGKGTLQLVGMILEGDDRFAFLLYRGQAYAVREGDVIERHYRILAVNEASVSLVDLYKKKEMTLNL